MSSSFLQSLHYNCVVVSEHMVKEPTIPTGDWSVTKLNQCVDQLLLILLERGLTKILWLHTTVIFATTIKKLVTLFKLMALGRIGMIFLFVLK